MRADVLRHALLILIAGCGLGVGSSPAADAGGEPDAAEAGADAVREPGTEAPEPRAARRRGNPTADEWWAHARGILLEGLELSEEQTQQIDAVIERQLGALGRARTLQADLQVAREQANQERIADLRAKLRANRAQIKRPHQRIEEIRAFVPEEQRPSFDMNRARLSAESQQSRKRPRRRKPGAREVKAE
jgi:hypothetical protein